MQRPPPLTDVCALADLEEGEARVFAFGHGWRPFELLVVRGSTGVRAYVNECAHHPLPLNIDRRVHVAGERVYCDHHYAAFRFDDGLCVEGVCPGQSLTPVPIVIDGDRVRFAPA